MIPMASQSHRNRPPKATAKRGNPLKRPASFLPVGQPHELRTVASSDGAISFSLKTFAGGIYVERVQVHPGTACVAQSMRFRDEASFTSWCEADRLRFTYPLVYSNLQRTGCGLLSSSQ